jgi:DNA repair protein RecN (Recombination protein N)
MLRELSVQNLALIEDARVELEPGFCAWTGETGAGKTLLLTALNLLLGERGSADLIRTDAAEVRVTGVFEVSAPTRAHVAQILGADPDEEQVVLTRRLGRNGRSYASVNEQPVAVGTLRQIGAVLVDIHGQRESQSLLEPAYQLDLLDAFGRLTDLRGKYGEATDTVRQLRQAHGALTAQKQQRQRELALLRFEREELDAANLQPGETEELVRERERLANAQALQAFAAGGQARLYEEEGSVAETLGRLLKEAHGWLPLEPELKDVVNGLEGLVAEAHEVSDRLRTLSERWEADPARLEDVEERLRKLRRLETKYGRGIDELIAYHATLEDQERKLLRQETDLDTTATQLAEAFAKLKKVGADLSQQRQEAARRLTKEVQKQLADLSMAEARVEAQLTPVALGNDPTSGEVPANGLDQFELMLAANKGEPARPLRKVASGGEMSRTMLALKTVLAAHDRVGTLVFDEIDANVGGRLGDVLGQKLAALGQSHQIICVTHLPQVASYARHQWTIRKRKRGNRTNTTIERLADADRLEELASMLRGESRGETTRQEVAAMLEAARRRW